MALSRMYVAWPPPKLFQVYSFTNTLQSGQVCMSTEKIIVHSAVIDRFTAALVAASKKLGESQIMATPGAAQRIKGLVDGAVKLGAQVVNKDIYTNFKYEGNNRFPNLVIRGITDKMELYHCESFGPLASIVEISSDEEAVRVANDTVFGLVSAVWSNDLARAMRMSKRIDAG